MYRYIITLMVWSLGCEPMTEMSWSETESAPRFKAQSLSQPKAQSGPVQLRVMAYNIKYGAGRIPFWFDCWGDRVQMTANEVSENMAGLYALINEADPDILLVEEIELHSRRSAYYDMVQGILDNTKLNYGAYFQTWASRYIPSEGLGRMNLGNAIFSKHPLTQATRLTQSKRTDLDALTDMFYIRRAIGRAEIQVGERSLAAYVVHTEAYDEDGTKAAQIEQIFDVVSQEKLPFVLGGDFNELPPSAVRVEGFPDERSTAVCGDDFDQPPYTPKVMQPFFDTFNPAIDIERMGSTESEQARFFTHTVLGPDEANEEGQNGDWNRTLDYLFADKKSRWVEGSTDVLQRAGQRVGTMDWTLKSNPLHLSDHAPVFGIWEVAP